MVQPRVAPEFRTEALLQDKDVARWRANLAQGSDATADVYPRRLSAFCDWTKLTPKQLTSVGEKRLHDLLLDFVASEQKRGLAGSTIHTTLKVVKSWLAHNGVTVTRKIRVRGAAETPTLSEERVPMQEELRRVFLSSSTRSRVACVLVAHSGIRPEVLGNFSGVDGLRLKDIPDLRVRGKAVELEAIPAMVVVRPELSKARHRYFTFLGQEGCDYLEAWLQERLSAGEDLGPESPVLPPAVADKKFVRTTNIGDAIRKAIRGAGLAFRPYVLRAYFDTQLLLAESKGKLARDYRVFWMGHKGSMEGRYTTNKGRLPKEMLEDMRGSYSRCEQFLSTVQTKKQQDSQTNVARIMLLGLGYSEDELKDQDIEDVSVFQELVRRKMQQPPAADRKQKVVDLAELPSYLEAHWRFVSPLDGGRAVVDPPTD